AAHPADRVGRDERPARHVHPVPAREGRRSVDALRWRGAVQPLRVIDGGQEHPADHAVHRGRLGHRGGRRGAAREGRGL
ncbi:MAG: Protein translocase membrane subunit SecG, partial [uncultured Pseudonocardia sp.]